MCLDVSTNASFVSSSWRQRRCICVCTSGVQLCLLGVEGPTIYPIPLSKGLRPVAAVGSNSPRKHPTQPPWISTLFPPGDFPPRTITPALPPRPQCLSPPGPRCSKLVPAQSFIDFKIEANSGLKKKKKTHTHNEARERQSLRLEGEDRADMGPESERDRERQGQSQI